MNSIAEAEKLLSSVCEVDSRVNLVMDEETKAVIIKELADRFNTIIEVFPNLVTDIQERITKYQANENTEVTDFIHLVEWYGMFLSDSEKEVDYWSPTGKYYNLRMNEVINLFLIYKVNSL